MEMRRVAHWRKRLVKIVQQEHIPPQRDQHFVLFAPREKLLRHEEWKNVKTVRQVGTNHRKPTPAYLAPRVLMVTCKTPPVLPLAIARMSGRRRTAKQACSILTTPLLSKMNGIAPTVRPAPIALVI